MALGGIAYDAGDIRGSNKSQLVAGFESVISNGAGGLTFPTTAPTVAVPFVYKEAPTICRSFSVTTSTTARALPHMKMCSKIKLINRGTTLVEVIDGSSGDAQGVPLIPSVTSDGIEVYMPEEFEVFNPEQLYLKAASGTPSVSYLVTRQPTRFYRRITGITNSGTTATATTAVAHGLTVDDWIYIEGVADNSGDGALYMRAYALIAVASVPTTTTFTYTMTGTPSGAATKDADFSSMGLII